VAKVAKAELLISLSEQERLLGSMGDAYMAAALAYNAVGRQWEAERWAMMAVDEFLVSEGPTDDRVKDMRILSREPRLHWSWRE
jgi:hypothetical protein